MILLIAAAFAIGLFKSSSWLLVFEVETNFRSIRQLQEFKVTFSLIFFCTLFL